MEDVIYHNGAFHFLAVWNLLVCTPALHQAAPQVHQEWCEFLQPDNVLTDHLLTSFARYLVESRGAHGREEHHQHSWIATIGVPGVPDDTSEGSLSPMTSSPKCLHWMAGCCSSDELELLPPQLTWLLHPSTSGPTLSCFLGGGGDDLSINRTRVLANLRAARFFRSYDGGWLFLTSRWTSVNMVLNLRSACRVHLPEIFPSPSRGAFGMIMSVATLSSPLHADGCFSTTIIDQYAWSNSRHITFWRIGHDLAMPSIPPRHPCSRLHGMEDVIYHNGAFHFLAVWNLLVCTPELHQGAPLPPLAFRVFQMMHLKASVSVADDIWSEVPVLDGKMLFVKRGTSRSYEVADFCGFQEGIYFFDDQCFYTVHRII
ncbi:hypothetical protein E2562_022309 [Oryza meyeriana var. granulata]|uniref:KIB1-4 beta-propeller domain-containing protein n=1 Tax=Oryza meyeriana var. granulata TaxID=110450 RepID=A0A6G1D6A0_9ORYZ|nr:hypothetical protein E2562_022309 [Oryza meyeriana var. granulata]